MGVPLNARGAMRGLLVWTGGGALLVAMAVDTLAMLGRQLRWPLLGSIEIVQTCVLVAAAGALLLATALDTHARVRLLLRRLSPRMGTLFERLHTLAGILFIAALLVGSAWIALDLRGGYEESELLRIPWMPLRLIVVALQVALLAILFRRLFARRVR